MKTICLLLAFGLIFSGAEPALAQSDDEAIIEAMGQSAIEGAKQKIGEEAIKEMVNRGLQSVPAADGSSAGSDFIAWAKIFMAAKNYGDAKNDKERFFAAGDGAAAGLTLYFPPAGVVVGVVLFAGKLADAAMSFQHAKEMADIQAATMRAYEATMKTYRQIGEAEATRFLKIYQAVGTRAGRILELQEKLQSECGDIAQNALDVKKLEACQALSMQVFPAVHVYLDAVTRLLAFEGKFISVAAFYEKAGVDRAAYEKNLAEMKAKVAGDQQKAKELAEKLGRYIVDAEVKLAIRSQNLDPLVELRNLCFSQVSARAWALNVALFPKAREGEFDFKARVAEVYGNYVDPSEGMCQELRLSPEDLLTKQLVLLKKSEKAAELFLFGEAI